MSWAPSHYLTRSRFLPLKQKLQAVLRIRITSMRIPISTLTRIPEPFLRRSGSDFSFDADPDPDPAFHFDAYPAFNANPDPAFHSGADPDPQH